VQIGLILGLSRLMGYLFARIRQPQVIGEMVAGLVLGPSLLGAIAPRVYHQLFPESSISTLNLLSQIGVVIFLFLIGLEFDPNLIRNRGKAAAAISITSIAIPFAIGVGLAHALYPALFNDPHGQKFFAAALFMGAAISVTAFPVLARILTERNLHKTPVGALSIAGAAVDDVSAWCLLAIVTAVAQHTPGSSPRDGLITLILAGIYVLFMLLAVRPVLQRLRAHFDRRGELSPNLMAAILLLVLASAYATERIGIHALFGAFLMGCVMPKASRFVRDVRLKIEDFTLVFLLPVFFAYAGLKADITQIFAASLWGYALLIIAAACAGKIGGAALAAKACGQRWRESVAVGVLMNTRGLMELIILTVGLSLGVINQNVYSMMVIMALTTTAMTSPLLEWIYPERLFGIDARAAKKMAAAEGFSILIPVAAPDSGPGLARIASMIVGSEPGRIFALHLRRATDSETAARSVLEEQTAEAEDDPILAPLLEEAKQHRLTAEPVSFVTRDVAGDIAAVAKGRTANLVLIGFHKPVIGATILGGTVHRVLAATPSDVAIFVDRGVDHQQAALHRILVPFLGSPHDRRAMELAGRIARNTNAAVTVLHVVAPKRADLFGPRAQPLEARSAVDKVFKDPTQPLPVTFRVIEDASPVDAVLREATAYDLVVIGVAEQWGLESHLLSFRRERIASECPRSMLIVRHHM
jgi:Kef-type K+ transport system membrane component KefB